MAINSELPTARRRRRALPCAPARVVGLALTVLIAAGTASADAAPVGTVYVPALVQGDPTQGGVTAPSIRVALNETVSFAALVNGQFPAAGTRCDWVFEGSPSSAHSCTVSQTFLTAGETPVAVTPEGTGVAGLIRVYVGHPPRTVAGPGLGSTSVSGGGSGGTGTGQGSTGAGRGATKPPPRPRPKPVVRRPPPRPVLPKVAPVKVPGGQAVHGVLIADIGSPLDLRITPPPASGGGAGPVRKSRGGSAGISAVVGGIALALGIAGLGGLAERRRATLLAA